MCFLCLFLEYIDHETANIPDVQESEFIFCWATATVASAVVVSGNYRTLVHLILLIFEQ